MWILLLMILGMLAGLLSVSQVTLPSGTTQSNIVGDLLEIIPGGDCYLGEGSYSAVEAAAVFDGMDNVATELAANYDQINADMTVEPGDITSEQVMHEVLGNHIPGKINSNVSVGLVGVNNYQLPYFESDAFGATTKTIVVVSAHRNDIVVFNGVRFSCNVSGKGEDVGTVLLKAAWVGALSSKVLVYRGLPATAPS